MAMTTAKVNFHHSKTTKAIRKIVLIFLRRSIIVYSRAW